MGAAPKELELIQAVFLDKKTVGIVLKPGADIFAPALSPLLHALLVSDIKLFIDLHEGHDVFKIFGGRISPLSIEHIVKTCEFIVSVGGDGTMLGVMRLVAEGLHMAAKSWEVSAATGPYYRSPHLIGVNMGTLGFITDIELHEAHNKVLQIIKGDFTHEPRATVQITSSDGKTHIAANDILLQRAAGRLLNFKVELNGRYAYDCRADGLLISTPTGSTAYSLAAGGPIIDPQVPCLLLTPMLPQNLSSRPIVISDDTDVKITLTGTEAAKIYVDGNEVPCPDCTTYDIEVGPSVRFTYVRSDAGPDNSRDFTKALRNKLGWNA
jgi:NAD+ kinase